ncbi:MAG: IS66 family transposase, partial [Eggerthellaceae bacterium]|nr:IS66 family transposase [Eggerthellaceae bacterium]
FKAYYARLKDHLLKEDIIHADETRVQVLHEPDRTPYQTSWMWLFMSGACSDHQITCFEYNEHRSSSVIHEFLEGYAGTLTTDGYLPYFKLGPQVKNTACLSHIRRKFIEVMQIAGGEDAARRAGCVSVAAFDKINEIMNTDGCFKDLSPGERYKRRQQYIKPKMEEFESWANRQYLCAQKDSRLSKALAYALRYWPYLKHVLDDGRLELTNNRAERAIRKFAIGRSNFLFSNTPAGASTSAALYSILISAKLSGLRPFEFFTWLLTEMPNTPHLEDPDVMDRFMPWSPEIPDNCFMNPAEAKKEAEMEDELLEGFSYEALADALNED